MFAQNNFTTMTRPNALTTPAAVLAWTICLQGAEERRAKLDTDDSRLVLGKVWQSIYDLADAKVKRIEGHLADAKAAQGSAQGVEVAA